MRLVIVLQRFVEWRDIFLPHDRRISPINFCYRHLFHVFRNLEVSCYRVLTTREPANNNFEHIFTDMSDFQFSTLLKGSNCEPHGILSKMSDILLSVAPFSPFLMVVNRVFQPWVELTNFLHVSF